MRPFRTLHDLCPVAALVLLAACAPASDDAARDVATPAAPPAGTFEFFGADAYNVPYDVTVPSGATSEETLTALGTFAWKEFIALNWPASYGVAGFPANQRGEPNTNVSTAAFTQVDSAPRVWQTYMHRVEIFPMADSGGSYPDYPMSFDTPPQYYYRGVDGGIPPCDGTGGDLSTLTTYFNNLDETSEIGLCTLFVDGDPNAVGAPPPEGAEFYQGLPGQPRRFIYQAKANETMFDYISGNDLYDMDTRWALGQTTFTQVTTEQKGGVAPCPDGVLCFPPGVARGQPGATEGAIEVKATWRQLTADEYNSGRFLTATIINYTSNTDGDTCYQIIEDPGVKPLPAGTVVPYGVTGLHIIHKTTHFPTFVFATFEQVDNLDQSVPYNELFYYNFNVGIVNPEKQYVTQRAHPIPNAIVDLNQAVHDELRQLLGQNGYDDSVWNYYQLVGVQGAASDYADDIDFFLANVTTETNEVLRSFSGGLDMATGTIDPTQVNIYQGADTFVGGGCKGCHGNAQAGVAPPTGVSGGDGSFDFSFITANAPFDGTPDLINASVTEVPQNWYPQSPSRQVAHLSIPAHGAGF